MNCPCFKDKYLKLEFVAEGTYGVVFKCKNIHTDEIYALKKFKNISKEGLPVSSIREIQILKKINSPYVLQPIDIYTKKSSVKMVI